MSFVYRDFLTPARAKWSRASAVFNGFENFFGTKVIDGVEVYNYGKHIFKYGQLVDTPELNRFLKIIGLNKKAYMVSEVADSEVSYLYINPAKCTKVEVSQASDIAGSIANLFAVGDEFTIEISYGGSNSKVLSNHLNADGSFNVSGVFATMDSDPIKYYSNSTDEIIGIPYTDVFSVPFEQEIESSSIPYKADPIAAVTSINLVNFDTSSTQKDEFDNIVKTSPPSSLKFNYEVLAVLDNGNVFEKVSEKQSTKLVYDKKDGTTKTEYISTRVYRYKKEVTPSDVLVSRIMTVMTNMGMVYKKKYPKTGNTDTSIKEACVLLNGKLAGNSQWFSYGGYLFLRKDYMHTIKRQEAADIILRGLDIGMTQKKKSNGLTNIFAGILVVLAVIAAFFGQAQVSGILLKTAAALTAASLVLGIGSIILAKAAPNSPAARFIGGVAQIVGLLATVVNIVNIIQNTWRQYVTIETGRAMAAGASGQQAASQVSVGGFVKYVVTEGINSLTGTVTNYFDKVTSFFSDLLDPSTTMYSFESISVNDVSGWVKNLFDSIDKYFRFFGDNETRLPTAEEAQAVKEDGVEPIFVTYNLLADQDALVKMDQLVRNNLGGQKTENFMLKIA